MKLFASLVAVLFLSACGSGGTANVTAPVTPAPTPDPSVQITSQPQSVTVPVGNPATFTVAANIVNAQAGDELSYQWYVTAPGGNTATAVGTNLSTYTIPSATLAQSGSVISVQVSVVNDAPAQSSDATLIVTPASTPPPSAPAPGFNSLAVLTLPVNTTSGQYFSATIPQVPAGVIVVCFVMKNPALDVFDASGSNVSDSLNDLFLIETNQPESLVYPPPNNSVDQGCYIAPTLGGANVTITLNTQAASMKASDLTAVALIYQGLSEYDSNANFSIAPVAPEACCSNNLITYNFAQDFVVAIGNDTQQGTLSVGNGWNQRFFASSSELGDILIEDTVAPSAPMSGAIPITFYVMTPGMFYANGVSVH